MDILIKGMRIPQEKYSLLKENRRNLLLVFTKKGFIHIFILLKGN